MADFDFQVFELGRKFQHRLKLQQLLFLLSGDFLVWGINALHGQTKLKWRVPYDRLVRGNDILGLCRKSAGKKGGRIGGEWRAVRLRKRREMEIMHNKVE